MGNSVTVDRFADGADAGETDISIIPEVDKAEVNTTGKAGNYAPQNRMKIKLIGEMGGFLGGEKRNHSRLKCFCKDLGVSSIWREIAQNFHIVSSMVCQGLYGRPTGKEKQHRSFPAMLLGNPAQQLVACDYIFFEKVLAAAFQPALDWAAL